MDEARRNMMGPEDWKKLEHFKKSEFECKCGCGKAWMNKRFVFRVDRLRAKMRSPLQITSGFRCVEYNKKIGGAPNSKHPKGLAVDLKVKNSAHRHKLLTNILDMEFPGVGVDKAFIHIDNREWTNEEEVVLWTYN